MSRNGSAQPTRAGRLLDVERFERVVAPGATTLLRLTGRLSSRLDAKHDTLALVVDDGAVAHRVRALPAPGPGVQDTRVSAAFAVPTRLVADGRAAFALMLGGGTLVDLPAPSERTLRAPQSSAPAALIRRPDQADALQAELNRLRP